ncbi:cysteine-rich protein 2-binding protein isoform X2 [Ahaetulla prasina]|uniref:cysteine-rich protein 2-binding protein isoform X2 n=1 Tax=Ahaetulla prasina TaxID=499056 RepID=UPI0026471D14|nr:cysteine-rich protein 2-binding protein isoform X2 [Ahaetulla prasina]
MDKNAYMSDMMTCHDDEATRASPSEGLEEGEVEGETLLIVESEDQASVDLSHDQSGDSMNSDEGETSYAEELSYYCERCQKWLPASHTREQITYLKGDNFFKFTCSDCSEDGKEQFERLKLTWQQVVMLAMYNLSLEGTGRQGYFRWKEDICAFIEKHWSYLLGNRKKTSTWWSTVAGCLSVGSPLYFRSGAQEFGEPGWWKLVHNRPPIMKPEGEKLSVSSLKAKSSKLSIDPIITVEGLRKRVSRNPVESAMELKEKRSRTQEAKEIRRAQKEATAFMDRSTSSTPVKFTSRNRHSDIMLEKGEVVDFSSLSSSDQTPLTSPSPSPSLDFSAPGTPASHSATPSLLSEADLIPDIMPPQALFHDDEEMEGMIDPGIEYIPPSEAMIQKKMKLSDQIKQELMCEEGRTERLVNVVENHSSTHAFLQDQGLNKRKTQQAHKDSQSKYTSIGIYEEKLLLKNLEACINAAEMTPEARRLRRKLIVRKMKRERGLPLFNLDDIVNSALILVDQFYGTKERHVAYLPSDYAVYKTSCQAFRILDRYQTKVSAAKEFQHRTTTFWCRLVGSEDTTDHSLISPYTSRVLKPYIRRDYENRPPKLQLLMEIRAHYHKNDPSWTAEPEAPIDYCYVRPNHIPTINSLCHEFFWPGIDLSECLQYPDFSVVVLYKKVIVAFGFMVPDVKYNEAYISFLFVHPEWRRSGIATFMIYHLIQVASAPDKNCQNVQG